MNKKAILQSIIATLFIAAVFLVLPKAVFAACPAGYSCQGGCEAVGACAGGKICIATYVPVSDIYVLSPGDVTCGGGTGKAILGGVTIPSGVIRYAPIVGTSESIGIVNFASRLLRIFTIVCGLWFMFNMIIAGYLFLASSGDSAVFGKFKESLFYSLIGLFIVAIAYLIAGLIGTIFFGNAGFIIRPTLFQAGS